LVVKKDGWNEIEMRAVREDGIERKKRERVLIAFSS